MGLKVLSLFDGTSYFTKDTLVLTDVGYKCISDIRIGDYVLSHDNKLHKVTDTIKSNLKNIWEIKCMGAETINTTSNCKFYVRQKIRKYDKSSKKYITSYSKPIWKNIKELDKTYYVCYAVNKESKIPEWNGIDYYCNQNSICHKNTLDFYDKKFWYIVGRFIGDGWVRKNNKKGEYRINKYTSIIICCGKHEVNELKNKIEGVFNYSLTESRTTFKFQISNTELAMFLSQFGIGAKNKFVPKFVMDLPIDLLSEFLKGYFDADGYFNSKNNVQSFSTISKKLAYGIEHCIIKVTHKPCCFCVPNMPSKHIIEDRVVNQNKSYIVNYRINDVHTQGFYENGYMWLPIRNITQTEKNEDVYNILIDNQFSFTVNGFLVNNCNN